jgi:hypothetical protein
MKLLEHFRSAKVHREKCNELLIEYNENFLGMEIILKLMRWMETEVSHHLFRMSGGIS